MICSMGLAVVIALLIQLAVKFIDSHLRWFLLPQHMFHRIHFLHKLKPFIVRLFVIRNTNFFHRSHMFDGHQSKKMYYFSNSCMISIASFHLFLFTFSVPLLFSCCHRCSCLFWSSFFAVTESRISSSFFKICHVELSSSLSDSLRLSFILSKTIVF